LRAAAEVTRLRILSVLAAGELTVSELASALGQSQPRVSRHLKLLCDAKLLVRQREQHWIHYRLADAGEAAGFARTLLDSLDPDDVVLSLDRERAAVLRAGRSAAGRGAAPEEQDARDDADLAAVLRAELGETSIGSLLYVGDAPAGVLSALRDQARHAVALSASADALARTRGRLQGVDPARLELRLGDPCALPFAADRFDVVILDRVDDPQLSALREAARVLSGAGRLVDIEDYEWLEERAAGGNPLVVSRDRLARAGLDCSRLRPLDLDSSRLLIAIAAPGAWRHAAA
jgi:DNA-binding transcriptional ArsR family regulator